MNFNRESLSLSDKQIYKARASLHHRMCGAYLPAMSQYFINLVKKEKMFMGYSLLIMEISLKNAMNSFIYDYIESEYNEIKTFIRFSCCHLATKYAETKGPVTRCNFSCNLSRNGVARQVARVIAPFNMPCNGQNRCETSCMEHCTE